MFNSDVKICHDSNEMEDVLRSHQEVNWYTNGVVIYMMQDRTIPCMYCERIVGKHSQLYIMGYKDMKSDFRIVCFLCSRCGEMFNQNSGQK